jgi:hypothetical protein
MDSMQPGCLLETRSFPSPPRGGFGLLDNTLFFYALIVVFISAKTMPPIKTAVAFFVFNLTICFYII